MKHKIQPPTLAKHEIILQARRFERQSEERRLIILKARLYARAETPKPVARAS